MELVLCTERFWPAHGGVERYVFEIARMFRDTARVLVVTAVRGDRTLHQALLASRGSAMQRDDTPLDIEVLTLGLDAAARHSYRAITAIERVIHSVAGRHYYRTRWQVQQQTAALLSSNGARCLPRVGDRNDVVVHAMGPWELGLVGDLLFPQAARVVTPFIHPGHWGEDVFSRRWFRSRDGVVALGHEDFKSCEAAGVAAERIAIVPTIAPPITEGLPRSRRRTVLFLGVARPYKGVDVFVETARIAENKGLGAEFVWAGAIPSEAEGVAGAARRAGVRVVGAVDEHEKTRLLGEAHCVCLPSSTEIAPYAILEAWAANTPVVVTDVEPLREFVADGGLICQKVADAFAAAATELVARPELADTLARNGRAILRSRHDAATIASQLISVYEHARSRRAAIHV